VYTHVHALRKTAIKTAVVFDLPPDELKPFCAAPQLGQMTAAATRPLPQLAQNLVYTTPAGAGDRGAAAAEAPIGAPTDAPTDAPQFGQNFVPSVTVCEQEAHVAIARPSFQGAATVLSQRRQNLPEVSRVSGAGGG
jgi:hypothetical protein